MSRSTFNGPVLDGVDDAPHYYDTSSNLTTGPNWGFINMSQSYPIAEQGGQITTNIIIPHKSTITRISALVTIAWATIAPPNELRVHVGTSWGAYPGPDVDLTIPPGDYDNDDLVKSWDLTAIGNYVVGPGDTDDLTGDDIDNWMRMPKPGATYENDRIIIYDTTNTTSGTGRAVLTVNYCQAVDLSAIA